jgi:isopentenyl-diphosphate delta-isomerase
MDVREQMAISSEAAASAASVRARKAEHLALALDPAAEPAGGAGWGDLALVHDSLPEIDLEEVDLTTEFLGAQLRAPLMIAGMTGGHPEAEEINARLGAAAQRHGLAVGVGSQRAALLDRSLEGTFAAVRRSAPDAFVVANIGVAQLVPQGARAALSPADFERIIEMVAADALAVHLNFLEETIQPEGDRCARGCAAAIACLCKAVSVPVIAKETGGGMAPATATRLVALDVAALDVGGAGGTSFTAIEQMRAERQGDAGGSALGETFARWGTPTPVAVAAAARTEVPVIASGGIRSGLDAAKALALGATAVAVARPLLAAARAGESALDAWIDRFLAELRTALFLTGCTAPMQLRERPIVVSGHVRAWLEDLGLSGGGGRG